MTYFNRYQQIEDINVLQSSEWQQTHKRCLISLLFSCFHCHVFSKFEWTMLLQVGLAKKLIFQRWSRPNTTMVNHTAISRGALTGLFEPCFAASCHSGPFQPSAQGFVPRPSSYYGLLLWPLGSPLQTQPPYCSTSDLSLMARGETAQTDKQLIKSVLRKLIKT